MTAGGLGAAVGSPADLVMVRMQADGRFSSLSLFLNVFQHFEYFML
jgi:hypothetical protein